VCGRVSNPPNRADPQRLCINATQTLSQFVAISCYDDFDDSVVEAAKIAILDGVANMLAGSTQELASIVGRYVQDMGGSTQSSELDGDSKPTLRPPLSPMESLAIAWISRFKVTRRLTVRLLAYPRRWLLERTDLLTARQS